MVDQKSLGILEKELSEYAFPETPQNLFNPLKYFLNLGGKRLRPLLTILGCKLFGGDIKKAISPALAIELFHNFSLIHDDIMDEAPLRRGKKTVHTKWNTNIAILSGDALLVESYKRMAHVSPNILPQVMDVFSATAMQVCEGQQYDMDFEQQAVVSEEEYINMIQYKTSVLLGCALKIGALIAEAKEDDAQKLYQFGLFLGTSFQIKDDYLDAFGDPEKFGKQVGGDILSNKKTLLLIHALDISRNADAEELDRYLSSTEFTPEEKVFGVTSLYKKLNVDRYALEQINKYYNLAVAQLDSIELDADAKAELYSFAKWLHERDL